MIECIVLAASICLSEDASIEAVSHGFFSGALITVDDVEITSELRSDNVAVPDRSTMQKLCDADICVHYRLRCSTHSRSVLCDVEYATSSMSEIRRLSVKADSGEQMIPVVERLFLVPPDGPSLRVADLGFGAAIMAASASLLTRW